VRSVQARFGHIDLLVNNAGANTVFGPAWEVDPDAWWGDVRVNLLGPFLCSAAVLPEMVAHRRGRIVNIASGTAGRAFPNNSAYAASKAALVRLTDCLAAETAPYGVSVFALGPGTVRSAMSLGLERSAAGRRWLGDAIGALRFIPAEVPAAAVVLLASGQADSLSGRWLDAADDIRGVALRAADVRAGDLFQLRRTKLPTGKTGLNSTGLPSPGGRNDGLPAPASRARRRRPNPRHVHPAARERAELGGHRRRAAVRGGTGRQSRARGCPRQRCANVHGRRGPDHGQLRLGGASRDHRTLPALREHLGEGALPRGKARIGLPEVRRGLIAAGGGTQRTVRMLGRTHALNLSLRGLMIDADRAEQIGLITQAVDSDELDSATQALADELLQLPTLTMAAIKRCVNEGGDLDLAGGLAVEQREMSALGATEDTREGVRAFVEKREPQFVGR
jgi:short chain dehydrogenase/Enoyl-CoA hydratase/isomerase